jgi:pimeloyl-ACP methyl ester carboxylesterase
VLDLRGAVKQDLGAGAVRDFLGPDTGNTYDLADPLTRVPLDVPVWCVHGRDDLVVPIEQSRTYVDAAHEAGAAAELVDVDGDHFALIDPSHPAWARTLEILDAA